MLSYYDTYVSYVKFLVAGDRVVCIGKVNCCFNYFPGISYDRSLHKSLAQTSSNRFGRLIWNIS